MSTVGPPTPDSANLTDPGAGEGGAKSAQPVVAARQNFLEWLKARGLPDSLRPVIIGIASSFSVAPYIGGRTISIFGASPVSIPTVPENSYWLMVFSAPVLWLVLFLRLIPFSTKGLGLLFAMGVGSSILLLIINDSFPQLALDSISPNFDQTFQLGYQDVGHTWVASHVNSTEGESYCHFRTAPLPLATPRNSTCMLRVDRASIEGLGRADVSAANDDKAAFDLEIFVSSKQLLSETAECIPAAQWEKVKKRPNKPDVFGHSIIYVPKIANRRFAITNYNSIYDFSANTINATPERGNFTELRRGDFFVPSMGAAAQISGWTLWGDPVVFQFEGLILRVEGRLHCEIIPSIFLKLSQVRTHNQ